MKTAEVQSNMETLCESLQSAVDRRASLASMMEAHAVRLYGETPMEDRDTSTTPATPSGSYYQATYYASEIHSQINRLEATCNRNQVA